MAETEPIETRFTAETGDLEAGTHRAKAALHEYGNEVEATSTKSLKLFRETTSVFQIMLAVRGAFSLAERSLKLFGIENANVARALNLVEFATYAAIVASKLYSAAKAIEKSHVFASAIAHFTEAVAKVSGATLFIGTIAALGVAIAAVATLSALQPPKAQFGGIIPGSQHGTTLIAGERGRPEAIIPLDRADEFGFGGRGGVSIQNINLYSNDPDEMMRKLGRRIEQIKASGA